MIRFPDTQLTEIALALEESEHPFVWVVNKIGTFVEKEDESWLPEGFEERVNESNKGVIIRDWAPQVLILAQPGDRWVRDSLRLELAAGGVHGGRAADHVAVIRGANLQREVGYAGLEARSGSRVGCVEPRV